MSGFCTINKHQPQDNLKPLTMNIIESITNTRMIPSKSCLMKDNSVPRQAAQEGVRFDYLTISEFSITLGDNVPREGPPITMAAKATRKLVICLDRFEAARPERRDTRDLYLDANDRISLLLLEGFSMREIADAALEACSIKVDREHNAKLSSKQRLHKDLDTTRRTLKSLVIRPTQHRYRRMQ
jgi:hypothetical protein